MNTKSYILTVVVLSLLSSSSLAIVTYTLKNGIGSAHTLALKKQKSGSNCGLKNVTFSIAPGGTVSFTFDQWKCSWIYLQYGIMNAQGQQVGYLGVDVYKDHKTHYYSATQYYAGGKEFKSDFRDNTSGCAGNLCP